MTYLRPMWFFSLTGKLFLFKEFWDCFHYPGIIEILSGYILSACLSLHFPQYFRLLVCGQSFIRKKFLPIIYFFSSLFLFLTSGPPMHTYIYSLIQKYLLSIYNAPSIVTDKGLSMLNSLYVWLLTSWSFILNGWCLPGSSVSTFLMISIFWSFLIRFWKYPWSLKF